MKFLKVTSLTTPTWLRWCLIKIILLCTFRDLIPFPRNRESFKCYEHIGIYVYRKPFLMEYIEAEDTPLHLTESLEQLKALELGYKIKVVETKYRYEGLGVDTEEDLEKVREILKKGVD